MSDEVQRRLQELYTLLRRIEHEAGHQGVFRPEDLERLSREFSSFAAADRTEVAKLADLSRHLTPNLSLRTFVSLIVPVERALEKSLRDDEFLVTDRDRETPVRTFPVRLVLDDLRSAFNVGSILRSADGLGVEKVHLCGYTPTPDNMKTGRTALGAEAIVPWDKADDLLACVKALKGEGYRIIALETAGTAQTLEGPFVRQPTAFVLGNERFGLSSSALAACDEVRELPLVGRKNSLNVSVIAAVAVYEWRRQWMQSF